MAKTKDQVPASMENIYSLNGRVPLLKSIPFGLQHVLAMFVANIAPIMIVTAASGLSTQETASLIQTAMIMAGIGTLAQTHLPEVPVPPILAALRTGYWVLSHWSAVSCSISWQRGI